jgi:hypothetical protein
MLGKNGLSIVLVVYLLSSTFSRKYISSTSFPLLFSNLELNQY